MAEQTLSAQSSVLSTAFAECAASPNSFELLDTLQVIGAAWKELTESHYGIFLCWLSLRATSCTAALVALTALAPCASVSLGR